MSPNYPKGLAIMQWVRLLPPQHQTDERIAAAIAAHLNAKDEYITRLLAQVNDLGYPL